MGKRNNKRGKTHRFLENFVNGGRNLKKLIFRGNMVNIRVGE
jgi:hypothetical protein